MPTFFNICIFVTAKLNCNQILVDLTSLNMFLKVFARTIETTPTSSGHHGLQSGRMQQAQSVQRRLPLLETEVINDW